MTENNSQELQSTIAQAFIELKTDYKENQQGNGWHQFFNSDKVGIVATSQAVLLLREYSEDFHGVTNAIQFILGHQMKTGGPFNFGGWPYITNLSDVATTESTCWALQAIHGVPGIDADIQGRGLNWLETNFIQSSLSGWGTVFEGGFRTYSTCIALRTLKLYGKSSSAHYRQSLSSLRRIQHADGGWGGTEAGPSTLVHTAHCIIALLESGVPTQASEIRRGIEWMIRALKSQVFRSDSIMGYVEIIDLRYTSGGDSKSQRINFYHMPLPYAALALIMAKYPDRDLIYNIICGLINEHQYGRWFHPYLPDTMTVWSMYDVLRLFREFVDSIYYQAFDQFFYIDPNQPKEKFDVIIFTVVPVEFKTLNNLLSFAEPGRSEDYKINGSWYYKYPLQREGKSPISCLITMIGSAGDIDCSIACNNAFSSFDCDLAVVCGIAAGNKEEISKYSSVIADSIVAYEYQRWEEGKTVYRPKIYQLRGQVKKNVEKTPLFDAEFRSLLSEFVGKLDFHNVENYSPDKAKNSVGAVASGAKLIADGKTLQILRENIPIGKGIIAAEMEGSGFAPACEANNVDWLTFRGISDFGEDDKNDPKNKEHQPLAVASAAASLICYLRYIY